MLILTRKIGETIWIGQDIEIIVLKPRPGSRDDVVLGFNADKDKYPITRDFPDTGDYKNGQTNDGTTEDSQ